MKKLAYILSLVAAAAFTVVSCEKEPEAHPFGPAETAGCYGVFFPSQEASGSHVFSPVEDPSIDIIVKRTNTNGAITVPVTATFSEDGIFTMNEVSFADGQDETTFTVRFDNAVEGNNYSASFTVDDNNYASIYNSNPISLDFSVMRVEMKDFLNPVTGEPAVITLNEGWWGEVHLAKMKYYEVNGIRTCTIYSIEEGNGIWGDAVDATLEFTWYTKNSNNEGHNFLEVKKQYFGFDYADWGSKPESEAANPIYVYDYPWYWIERGYAWGDGNMQADWLAEAEETGQVDGSYPVGYYDGNGGFYFNLRYYIPGLGGFSSNPYEFVAIADGYSRVDYSFELEADYTSMGVTPISVEAGADVASLKYAVYEGELTATQVGYKVDAIIDGSDESVSFDEFEFDEEEAKNYATLGVAPEKTGMYTLVAVAYDKDGKPQNSASVIFKHIAGDDEEEYAVELSVFTEDTPARYANYHNYDSFAYCVLGKDLTDVHIAVMKYADVVKDVNGTFDAVKKDAKGTYAVSADVLAQINGEGGYYTVATKLPAKTDMLVIVWATNGDMDAFDYDFYTTARLPYQWNSLGKGTWTDGNLLTLFGMDDVTVDCDVYEEASTPGLYMVTGFQLALTAAFYECDPSEIVDYEGEDGNWWNAEILVDATDPAKVYIEEQHYGIYVNGTYGYAMMDSDPMGTLENGAITFPAKKMYVGFTGNGKWYYGNGNGTFKITLPAAAAGAPANVPAVAAGQAPKTNFVLAPDASIWNKPVMSFERDPQPIKVNVTVSHERKAKASSRELAPESLR